MNKKIISLILVTVTIGCLNNSVHARPSYLTTWISQYAQDNPEASETGCQLCHQRGGGGNGWNEYGWDIRNSFIGTTGSTQQRLLNAFAEVENINTDLDDSSSNTYLQEVRENAQPGWREGEVNIIRRRVSTATTAIASTTIQAPPSDLPCGTLVDPNSSLETFCDGIVDPQPTGIAQGNLRLELETVATDFASPVLAVSEPSSPNSIYVVEQGGTIQKVNLNSGTKELFLDFSNEVVSGFGGFDERGLLGFAFDPDYQNNNRIYTYISKDTNGRADFSTLEQGQSANHQTVISEWVVRNPQSNPVAGSEREILVIDQPQFNHNGGTIVFGPEDNLFISLGDGGGANDNNSVGHGENGNGRDNTNPLGSILRINPRGNNSANRQYGVPADNPFVGGQGLDEIYAYGFRNPYRFSIEELPNNDFNLYVGDVGQGDIEEVDLITRADVGGNYGWNYKEGSFYFFINPDGTTFISETPPVGEVIPPLIDPITEYDHDEGISVIGGHVYTGSAIRELDNRYVFAEWSRSFSTPSGRLFYLNEDDEMREFDYVNGSGPGIFVTGFGQDNQNELYIVGSLSSGVAGEPSGSLIKLVPEGGSVNDEQFCFPIRAKNHQVVTICL